jgi:hypothetical protein
LCNADYDENGVTENRTFIRSKTNIAAAASAIATAGVLSTLEWEPQVFFAAKI